MYELLVAYQWENEQHHCSPRENRKWCQIICSLLIWIWHQPITPNRQTGDNFKNWLLCDLSVKAEMWVWGEWTHQANSPGELAPRIQLLHSDSIQLKNNIIHCFCLRTCGHMKSPQANESIRHGIYTRRFWRVKGGRPLTDWGNWRAWIKNRTLIKPETWQFKYRPIALWIVLCVW